MTTIIEICDKVAKQLQDLLGLYNNMTEVYDEVSQQFYPYYLTADLKTLQYIQRLCRTVNLHCSVRTQQCYDMYHSTGIMFEVFIADFPNDLDRILKGDYFNFSESFYFSDSVGELNRRIYSVVRRLQAYVKDKTIITKNESMPDYGRDQIH